MVYNPARDTRNWYTRLLFAQHVANLLPLWGRSIGTGNPGITFSTVVVRPCRSTRCRASTVP